MIVLTYNQVKDVVKSKYGKWWTSPYDLNVFGVRNPSRVPNKFDDTIGIAYTDSTDTNRILLLPATTDPGLFYLQSPINSKGCAILVEGYYPGLWRRGLHKGYRALVQTGYANIIRDNDRDTELDFQIEKCQRVNNTGLNLHRANASGTTNLVGKWSAGCQVVANAEDYKYIIQLSDLQYKYGHGEKYSYALLNEKDFE